MTESIKKQIATFKADAIASAEIEKVTDSQIIFRDGKVYIIYEPDKTNPESNLCIFDFGFSKLTHDSFNHEPDGSNVGQIKVDIKTNPEGDIIGLNPVNLETTDGAPPFDGATVMVGYKGWEYQVRYANDLKQPGTLIYAGIYEMSGKPLETQDILKTILSLPPELDIFATTMQLLDMKSDNNINNLRRNPFIIPKPIK
ncbi:MAG: hypothetical protein WC744_00610 [Patescibacteria group bacterium]|jgi:hypothetical protein